MCDFGFPFKIQVEIGPFLSANKISSSTLVKQKYFGNFSTVAGWGIVPKHLYENPSKKQQKKLNKTIIGTGPYKLKKFQRGKKIVLDKNKSWWGNTISKGENNYDRILLRFVKDGNIAIQRMAKGDLDYIPLTAEEFVKKTSGKKWGKSVFKVQIKNKAPKADW